LFVADTGFRCTNVIVRWIYEMVEVVRRDIKQMKRERERKTRKKRSLGNEQARSARFLKKQRERDGWMVNRTCGYPYEVL